MAAPNATVYKAELQVTDMDRHYYASHNLTLAQHPSETDLRLMARLIAFALFAEERLEFGRGLSNDEDPDLWLRNYTGEIDLWIDLGQPDESRIKKASGRALKSVVVGYSGNAFDIWWGKDEQRPDALQEPERDRAGRRMPWKRPWPCCSAACA